MFDRAGSHGWTTISIDALRAGDAIVSDGHIKLFSRFTASNVAETYEESGCGNVAQKEAQAFARKGEELSFDERVARYRGAIAVLRASAQAE